MQFDKHCTGKCCPLYDGVLTRIYQKQYAGANDQIIHVMVNNHTCYFSGIATIKNTIYSIAGNAAYRGPLTFGTRSFNIVTIMLRNHILIYINDRDPRGIWRHFHSRISRY